MLPHWFLSLISGYGFRLRGHIARRPTTTFFCFDFTFQALNTTMADEDSSERNTTTMVADEDNSENGSTSADPNHKRPAGPITKEGDRPQKKFYRQRAHCNPLSHNDSFQYPLRHDLIDWTEDHFPGLAKGAVPTVLDIGCGFGGLTLALGVLLPDETVLGMEIRAKVTEYVRLRISAARKEQPGKYENCSVLRTNSMKFLPNYFAKSSLNKLFFCFPDPHFKTKNHPRRIVSAVLLSEYAYCLKPGSGRLYCITDVEDLHNWHVEKCDAHPLFKRIDDLADDPCVETMREVTEEGQKVERAGGKKFYAVYQRIPNDEAVKVGAENFFAV
jgi:tRNA (guanine-N7-)-methyltransferase